MSTSIQPALTPEEWADRTAPLGDLGMTATFGRAAVVVGVGSSIVTTVANEGRHALAALCLHGQPYGFTWDDVRAIRKYCGSGISREPEPVPGAEAVWEIADRIAALLPPEDV